jgi:hypothetical protein
MRNTLAMQPEVCPETSAAAVVYVRHQGLLTGDRHNFTTHQETKTDAYQ